MEQIRNNYYLPGKTNKPNDEKVIDLTLIFRAIVKKLWLIVLMAIIFGGITFAGVKLLITPTYRSSYTALVNNKKEVELSTLTSSDVQASQALVRTYSEIITSRYVLNTAAESLGLNYSYGQLKSMVTVTISDETEIFSVNVESTNRQEAYRLADAIRKTSLDYTAQIVEGSSMKIIDNPEIPTKIFRPNYVRYTLFGAIGGALLTILIIIIKQLSNDKIMNEDELAERFSIPIVGIIPDMMNASNMKGGYYAYYGHREPDEEPTVQLEPEKKGEEK